MHRNELFKIWYADSLSLLQGGKHDSYSTIPLPSSVHKEMGIVVVSQNGTILEKSGTTDACIQYLKETPPTANLKTTVREIPDGLLMIVPSDEIIRIVFANHQLLRSILAGSVADAKLTESEFHLLRQILSGKTLKKASAEDGVSYETKRSQFKSLAGRTGLKTQSEVIRITLLGLISQTFSASIQTETEPKQSPNPTHDYLNLYYPDVFRFHQVSMASGPSLRIAETGPIDGTPVIWLHSQTLPAPGQFVENWPYASGIRLIIPLRQGFLDNPENEQSYDLHNHVVRSADEIIDTIKLFASGKAKIVSNSTGAPYATHIAVNNPRYIDKLVFCAPAYIGQYRNAPIKRLVQGVSNLVSSNRLLTSKMFDRYLSKMSTPEGALEVLESSYRDSEKDMEIFRRLIGNSIGHSWFYESYRLSRHSVIRDVAMSKLAIWENAEKIECPTLFVHGETDPINSIDDARRIADRVKNAGFRKMEHEGQSLFLNNLQYLASLE